MTTRYLIAGFGGQGALFSGKFLANLGIIEGKHVSWLPSYGPEMRGGTANCSVVVSDEPVGSPVVTNPDILVAMNLPSLDKFESTVKKGGTIYIDSTLITRKALRDDVKVVYIPATELASKNELGTLSNMIIFGSVLKDKDEELIKKTFNVVVSKKRVDMLNDNYKAFDIGRKL